MTHPLINRPCRVARPTFGDDYPAVICEVLTSGHLIVARAAGALSVVLVENVTLTDTAHLARVLDPQNTNLPRWVPAATVAVGSRVFAVAYPDGRCVPCDPLGATWREEAREAASLRNGLTWLLIGDCHNGTRGGAR